MGNLEKIVREKGYAEINRKALTCELGYYIGQKENINTYIQNNIIKENDKNGDIDNYMLFYLFCEYVVDIFQNSEVQDIYTLIDEDYIDFVAKFKYKYVN